jgi:deoxycytidylate deaminase
MLTTKDFRAFEVARAISKTSDNPSYFIGAVVLAGKSIIGAGCNSASKSHPMQKKYNQNRPRFSEFANHPIHAEIDALIKATAAAGKDLSNAKIYVYRENKLGKLAMSRPCRACMQAIKDFGIKDIYYSTEDGLSYESLREAEELKQTLPLQLTQSLT